MYGRRRGCSHSAVVHRAYTSSNMNLTASPTRRSTHSFPRPLPPRTSYCTRCRYTSRSIMLHSKLRPALPTHGPITRAAPAGGAPAATPTSQHAAGRNHLCPVVSATQHGPVRRLLAPRGRVCVLYGRTTSQCVTAPRSHLLLPWCLLLASSSPCWRYGVCCLC